MTQSDFESSKIAVTREVKKELKAEIINEKLAGLSGSLNEIASSYGSDARVSTKSDLKITDSSLPSVGQAQRR